MLRRQRKTSILFAWYATRSWRTQLSVKLVTQLFVVIASNYGKWPILIMKMEPSVQVVNCAKSKIQRRISSQFIELSRRSWRSIDSSVQMKNAGFAKSNSWKSSKLEDAEYNIQTLASSTSMPSSTRKSVNLEKLAVPGDVDASSTHMS